MGGVSLVGTSRSNYLVGVLVNMVQLGDGLISGLAATGTGISPNTLSLLGGLFGHRTVVPGMVQSVGIGVHVAVATGTGMGGVSPLCTGRIRNNLRIGMERMAIILQLRNLQNHFPAKAGISAAEAAGDTGRFGNIINIVKKPIPEGIHRSVRNIHMNFTPVRLQQFTHGICIIGTQECILTGEVKGILFVAYRQGIFRRSDDMIFLDPDVGHIEVCMIQFILVIPGQVHLIKIAVNFHRVPCMALTLAPA